MICWSGIDGFPLVQIGMPHVPGAPQPFYQKDIYTYIYMLNKNAPDLFCEPGISTRTCLIRNRWEETPPRAFQGPVASDGFDSTCRGSKSQTDWWFPLRDLTLIVVEYGDEASFRATWSFLQEEHASWNMGVNWWARLVGGWTQPPKGLRLQ